MSYAMLFDFGRIEVSKSASIEVPQKEIFKAVFRHRSGDWGAISEDEALENIFSIEKGLRIKSVYVTSEGIRFYVITEADRSITTILLPDEY